MDVLVMSPVALVDSKHCLTLLLEYCRFNCAFHSNIRMYIRTCVSFVPNVRTYVCSS